jgi:hypothetical protein
MKSKQKNNFNCLIEKIISYNLINLNIYQVDKYNLNNKKKLDL